MSVKTMLPLLGVGSAFAIVGLAAARRRGAHPAASESPRSQRERQPSGVHPRVTLDEPEGEPALDAPALTSDFWDAAPESSSLVESQRPASDPESYDAVDPEDLTAEWLTRATQAPPMDGFEGDDPAEIPADSISMISDASRHAAALDIEALDANDDDFPDSRAE